MVAFFKDGSTKVKLRGQIIYLFTLMVLFIEDLSRIQRKMDLENYFYLMALNTLVFGWMINLMVKIASKNILMEVSILGCLSMV